MQLWAVWAIHHVCTKNPGRYCHMLSSQGGQAILLALVREPATHHVVANMSPPHRPQRSGRLDGDCAAIGR